MHQKTLPQYHSLYTNLLHTPENLFPNISLPIHKPAAYTRKSLSKHQSPYTQTCCIHQKNLFPNISLPTHKVLHTPVNLFTKIHLPIHKSAAYTRKSLSKHQSPYTQICCIHQTSLSKHQSPSTQIPCLQTHKPHIFISKYCALIPDSWSQSSPLCDQAHIIHNQQCWTSLLPLPCLPYYQSLPFFFFSFFFFFFFFLSQLDRGDYPKNLQIAFLS